MGERAGYRCREGQDVSPTLRKQWFCGESKGGLENLIRDVADVLSTGALRGDLG